MEEKVLKNKNPVNEYALLPFDLNRMRFSIMEFHFLNINLKSDLFVFHANKFVYNLETTAKNVS